MEARESLGPGPGGHLIESLLPDSRVLHAVRRSCLLLSVRACLQEYLANRLQRMVAQSVFHVTTHARIIYIMLNHVYRVVWG